MFVMAARVVAPAHRIKGIGCAADPGRRDGCRAGAGIGRAGEQVHVDRPHRGVLRAIGPADKIDVLEGDVLLNVGEQLHQPADMIALRQVVDRTLGLDRPRRQRPLGRLIILQGNADLGELVWHFDRLAASLTAMIAGNNMPIRMPIMVITTNNSTRVKPRLAWRFMEKTP